jgi:hypothetical protein
MEIIRDFIKKYKAIQQNKRFNLYTNVYQNITHELKCMDFIENNLEMIETALEAYVVTCTTKENFLKEWLVYGIDLISKYLNDPYLLVTDEIKKLWPIFFEEPFFEGYDISYYNTRETQDEIKSMRSINRCTDEEILAIHIGKACDCMYICTYCDEMEHAWEKKVKQMYGSSTNIFLHPKLQSEFVKKWLLANQTYSDYVWPPKKVYYERNDYHSKDKPITDFAEVCAKIKENRKKYKEGGKTPLQCYDNLSWDIQGLFNTLQPAQSDFTIFMKLWNKIEMVPIWLRYDKARCMEILEML